MKKLTSMMLAASLCVSSIPAAVTAQSAEATSTISYKYGDAVFERQMEKLDRGLIAINTGDGIYVGWRMLGDEGTVANIKTAPDFNVYRNGEKIANVTDSTNYLDADGKSTDSYSVAIEGGEPCGAVAVLNGSSFDIPMDVPEPFALDSETSYSYTVGDASTGDLDGDGQYELVVKWDCNPKDNSHSGVTGNVYLDAYELDGTKLWRIDLGRNIRSGAHYTQFLVYDFDLDGIAEITAKTAPGSIDGKGNYVTEASSVAGIKNADNTAVYVNDGGYIIEGDEFFTAFDGKTGAAVDTIYYPNQRISAGVWGDGYGNRCDRFIADVAYLDGVNPYAVYWRGYYGGQSGYGSRTGICAIRLDENKKLQCDYCFDTYDTTTESGYKGVHGYTKGNETYIGQGNHNMSMADVDNDGKDEIYSGATCMEVDDRNKLVVKWCTFRGHGDALHVGDYDPTHDGLEFFAVHEGGGYVDGTTGKTLDYGMTVIDAETGEELYHRENSKDTGRGMMANVGSGGYYQIAGSAQVTAMGNGEFVDNNIGLGTNFRIFWDADIYDELLDGVNVTSWDGSTMSRIFSANGCIQINGTKANPALQADLFGDWREELCYPTEDNTAIRVFTTTDVTTYKLPTLMHDPVYRSGVAAEQTAYNQPPHVGFYLGEEIYRAELIGIDVTLPDKTEYVIGDKLDLTGLVVTGSYEDETNYDVTGYSVTGFDGMRAGEQQITVGYMGFEKSFTVNVATPFTCDDRGYITGYNGTAAKAIIPEAINDIEIVGIDEGALDNSPVTELYVYENIEYIENNSFSGITVYCYEGSEIHIYALDNDVAFELIERENYDYLINYTFEEAEFDGFGMYQSNSSQEATKGRIKFTVGGRNRGGDGTSGFGVETSEGITYLRCGIGQFASNGRQARMTLSDAPILSADSDNVLSFDFMIPTTASRNPDAKNPAVGYISLEDSTGVVDTVTISGLGIEFDTWYSYELIYHGGTYYRVLSDINGEIISVTKLGTTSADTGVTTLQFLQDPVYTTSNEFGKGSGTYIAMDNFKMYSAEAALASIYINVKDAESNPVEDASVTIGSFTEKTDMDGYAQFLLPFSIYKASIKADGYVDEEVSIAAYRGEITKKITMEQIHIPATDLAVLSSTALAIGQSELIVPEVIPSNATERNFVWSSDNEAVATVEDGLITGISEGSATVTVTLGNLCSEILVRVYDTSKYEQTANSIEITGGAETAYIPLSGVNTTVIFGADVRDQNGVMIEDADVEWSGDGVSVVDGLLFIDPSTEAGYKTITAKCGTISTEATIQLIPITYGADIYADLDYSDASSLALRQGTELVTSTIGDVTYGVNARANGGDGETGIYSTSDGENVYLTYKIGRFGESGRNPYMTFDKAPAEYEAGREYVFETDVYFESASTMSITLSNNVLISLMATEGIEAEKWYHYMLVYSNGTYTQYVYDENNELVSISVPTSSTAEPITQMDLVGSNGQSIMVDNTRYYSMENVMSKLTVNVKDIDGAEVTDADVSVGSVAEKTDARGRSVFELPLGVYSVGVNLNDRGIVSEEVVLSGENKIITIVYDESLLPTPKPTSPPPTPEPTDPYYIEAEVADGTIAVELKAYKSNMNTKVLYVAFYKEERLVSVSVTEKKRPSISADVTVPEGADSYTCMAWDTDDVPIARSVSGKLN